MLSLQLHNKEINFGNYIAGKQFSFEFRDTNLLSFTLHNR